MFKVTYNYIASSAQAGMKSLQYSTEISTNDVLFILLFMGLVSMLLCLGCITCCMGRFGIAAIIFVVAMLIVVIAGLIYEN